MGAIRGTVFYNDAGTYNASHDNSATDTTSIRGFHPFNTFVNYSGSLANFRLKTSAPVIGSGVPIDTFLWDAEGQIRGTAWDIGADEYGSGLDSFRPDGFSIVLGGYEISSGNFTMVMEGAWPSANIPLWIGTYDSIISFDTTSSGQSPLTLFMQGHDAGQTGIFNTFNFFMNAVSGANSTNIPMVITGFDEGSVSGNVNLWIGTYYSLEELLEQQRVTSNVPLFMTGSYLGGSGIEDSITFVLGGVSGVLPTSTGDFNSTSINLVIPVIEAFTTISSGIELYLPGASNLGDPDPSATGVGPNSPWYPAQIALVINGAYASIDNMVTLTIGASGETNSVNLRILGGGYNPDPFFVGESGALGQYGAINLMINRATEADAKSLNLVMPADLPTTGIVSLYLFAASGINNNVELVIPNINQGFTGSQPLYTHGF